MKDIAILALVVLVPVTCVIMAGILAWQDKEGWGWFLFVAVLLAGSISIKG
ncbi:hypothetical protein [Trabulsiella odontotermitis]|uniref:hypothetical protein n=1 Tax=Trabulsiella odontotermitis TaxID=379893 RepID=UPI000AA4332C|nr:hypothetical protein [Trabulsiella odontotermitis]